MKIHNKLLVVSLMFVLVFSLTGCGSDSGVSSSVKNYTITTEVTQGNGNIEVTPEKDTYQSGTEVTIEALPDDEYKFSKWSGNLSGTETKQTITVDSNIKIGADFIQLEYSLNINTKGNGTVKEEKVESMTQSYKKGEEVKLTAQPDEGWKFDHWEGDITGSESPANIIVDKEINVTAVFVKKEYTITTEVINGNGNIGIDPEKDTYQSGTEVTIEALPDEGYKFKEWSGDLLGNEISKTVKVDGDMTIGAIFEIKTDKLDIDTNGKGNYDLEPIKDEYEYGDKITITANPNEGWKFDSWSGDIDSTDNPVNATIKDGKIEVTSVEASLNITANFKKKTEELNISIEGNGSVGIEPEKEKYEVGEEVKLTAQPDEGWKFDHWEGDITGSESPVNIIVDKEINVTAVFVKKEYTITTEVTNGNGNIEVTPEKDTYQSGTEVTVEAVPDDRYKFSKWSESLSVTQNPLSIIINSNMTIAAEFEKIPNTDSEYFTLDKNTGTIKGYNTVGGFDIVIPPEIDGISVEKIGDSSFSQKDLTSVIIPNSVTKIGIGAFGENSLTTLEIPNSVTEIGDKAFWINDLEAVKIGDSVTEIGDFSFSNNNLTTLEIPNSVIKIGRNAFANNNLTTLEISNSVTEIGDKAFVNSSFADNRLIEVEMSSNVTLIGDPFDGNLKDVYEYYDRQEGIYIRNEDSNSWEKQNK